MTHEVGFSPTSEASVNSLEPDKGLFKKMRIAIHKLFTPKIEATFSVETSSVLLNILQRLSSSTQNLPEILNGKVFKLQTELLIQPSTSYDTRSSTDILNFYIDSQVPSETAQKIIDKVMHTWRFLRETKNSQQVSIVLVGSRKHSKLIRSCAIMDGHPEMIIECSDPNCISAAAHETVHAGFGAETGYPYSRDFAEGCAMRLGYQFEPTSNSSNLPAVSMVNWLKSGLTTSEPIRSSTTALDTINAKSPLDPQHHEALKDAMAYAFGYYLVDSLLKNTNYQSKILENMKMKNIQIRKKYSWLLYLNRLYNEEGQYLGNQFTNRLALTRVFVQKLGFSLDEFRILLNDVEESIRNA